MIDLRTFTYIDILQPQVASFLATVSQGYLPVEEQAALYIEISPGIAINRLTDIILKRTEVRPGMQIVERRYGVLEVHSFDQGEIREAGETVLRELDLKMEDRLEPRILTNQMITGVEPYHTQLVNRMRHGDMILKGETLYVLEVHPAGYAVLAANEAEKASPIKVLEVFGFGAFGRVYLGGGEAAMEEAVKAIRNSLSALNGRPNEPKKEKAG